MKAAASRRTFGAVKVETIIGIVVIAAIIWWRIDSAETRRKEEQRRQLEATSKAIQEASKLPPPVLPDSIKQMLPSVAKAEDPAARAFVGKKLRVVHPGYFTELGGVPAYTSGDEATRFSFPELADVAPGAELHPTDITKRLVLNAPLAMSKPTLLPVDTEFEVLEAFQVTGPYIFGKPLILKVRASGATRDYYVNAKCFPPASAQ